MDIRLGELLDVLHRLLCPHDAVLHQGVLGLGGREALGLSVLGPLLGLEDVVAGGRL